MKNKLTLIAFLLMVLPLMITLGQVYDHPNFAFSSHPTLELQRIEVTGDQTLVYMTITNKRIGGTFCVGKDTYLRNSLGDGEYKLLESTGIPDCPDDHKFTAIGEQLSFILVFPAISGDLKYIDIVENCEEACFSFKYILLDAELNELINRGFKLYESGATADALSHFEDLLRSRYDNVSPVFGTIYLYIMSIYYELGDSKKVRELFDELKQSSIIDKEDIMEAARHEGFVR